MHVTLILTILLNMFVLTFIFFCVFLKRVLPPSGLCIFYWIIKYYCTYNLSQFFLLLISSFLFSAAALIFTLIAILSVFSYFGFRSRIPLASLLLQVVMDVSKHHKSVYAVAFAALFFQAGLSV